MESIFDVDVSKITKSKCTKKNTLVNNFILVYYFYMNIIFYLLQIILYILIQIVKIIVHKDFCITIAQTIFYTFPVVNKIKKLKINTNISTTEFYFLRLIKTILI